MRKATSLIELIIAIIVMGIAVMSLPMILTQTQNNDAIAMQQEAILSTKAKMGFITSYMWDENSWDAGANISRILDTTNSASADNAFDVNTTTDIRRRGNFLADARRRLWDIGNARRNPFTGVQPAGINDISDFNSIDDNITLNANDMDYLFGITINATVNYLTDTLAGGNYRTNSSILFNFNTANTAANPTNIKMITLTTTSPTNSDINITLRSFASNIGQSKILKRVW
jgi:hypothetical protein